jgi:hypothetical protein
MHEGDSGGRWLAALITRFHSKGGIFFGQPHHVYRVRDLLDTAASQFVQVMNPMPLLWISVAIACPVAGILAAVLPQRGLRAWIVSLASGCIVALLVPAVGMAILLGDDWHDPIHCLRVVFVIGGILGAEALGITLVCANATTILGLGIRQLFVTDERIPDTSTEKSTDS